MGDTEAKLLYLSVKMRVQVWVSLVNFNALFQLPFCVHFFIFLCTTECVAHSGLGLWLGLWLPKESWRMSDDAVEPKHVSFKHRWVVSPMVGASDLPWRLLCRKYGADLCYTPMFYSERFVKDASYRESCFITCMKDRPLVVQFCANDPALFEAAGKLVQDKCDAVDLNLGCPQREARSQRYGSYLLDKEDRALVVNIVRTAASSLRVPVFCKIRLLPTLEETIELALQLQHAGCSLLCVHGRTRGSPSFRRAGPADLQAVAAIKSRLRIPVLSNGNVAEPQDAVNNLHFTGCDGVMVAESILHNPTLFHNLDFSVDHSASNFATDSDIRSATTLCDADTTTISVGSNDFAESATTSACVPATSVNDHSPNATTLYAGWRVPPSPDDPLRVAFEYISLVRARASTILYVCNFHNNFPALDSNSLIRPILSCAVTTHT